MRRPALAVIALVATLAACSGGSSGAPAPSAAPSTGGSSAGGPSAGGPSTAASATGSPSASGATPAAGGDWPTYHRTLDRAGDDPAFPDPGRLSTAWSHRLDGAVYASPVVVGATVFVPTENDSVYAFDRATGRQRWQAHLGTPVPLSELPCGDIDPLGITGTPAYDAATHTLFVLAEVTGPAHELVALDPGSGQVRWRRPVDVGGRPARAHQQRGALAVADGRVYIPYGGLAGDCGPYIGYVAAVPTNDRGSTTFWSVPTGREGGIWAPSGPAVAPSGDVYVAIGNGESTGSYDGSDSVTRLTADLRRLSFFAPTDWASHNAEDADLGSMGPLLLPDGRVLIAGKSDTAFLLDGTDLGGIGGATAQLGGCRAFGGAAAVGRTVVLPCTGGLRRLDVGPGASLRWGWQVDGVSGSPVIGGHTVWALAPGAGVLHAVDLATGRQRAAIPVGQVSRFATPALSGDVVLVGTLAGVTAVRVR